MSIQRSQLVDAFESLDNEDREKVAYFLQLLLDQEKYQKVKREIDERRKEIQKGEVLTHEEVWSQFDV